MNGAADSEDAGERLYAAAIAHAQSRGFRLGDGADQYFRQRSDEAARQLAGAANDEGFDLATANARTLIDAMIAAPKAVPMRSSKAISKKARSGRGVRGPRRG